MSDPIRPVARNDVIRTPKKTAESGIEHGRANAPKANRSAFFRQEFVTKKMTFNLRRVAERTARVELLSILLPIANVEE